MTLSLTLGLVYLVSEVVLTISRRSRSKTGDGEDGEREVRSED